MTSDEGHTLFANYPISSPAGLGATGDTPSSPGPPKSSITGHYIDIMGPRSRLGRLRECGFFALTELMALLYKKGAAAGRLGCDHYFLADLCGVGAS